MKAGILLREFLRSLIKDLTRGGCSFVHPSLLRPWDFTIQIIYLLQIFLWCSDKKKKKKDACFKDQENAKPFTDLVLFHCENLCSCVDFFPFFCSSLMLINLVRKTRERADSDWQASAAKGGGQRRKLRRRSGKKPFHTQRGGFLKCGTEGGGPREPAVRSLWCADEK